MKTPLYEVTVAGEDRTLVTAEALMEAWGERAPGAVAQALDLPVEGQATVFALPLVRIRRIR